MVDDEIEIVVPPGNECSCVYGIADPKPYPVILQSDGRRTVRMKASDARMLVGGTSPSNLPWRKANPELAAAIGKQVHEPAVRVADILRAAREAAPRHPFDKGGIAKDTLRAMGIKL